MKIIMSVVRRNRFYFLSLLFLSLSAFCGILVFGSDLLFFSLDAPHPVWLNIFFVNYTFMGDGFFALVLAAFYFFYLGNKETGILLFSGFLFTEAIVQVVNNSPGHSAWQLFLEQGQYLFINDESSFAQAPAVLSGHTAVAFALVIVFMVRGRRKQLQLPLLIAAVLMAISRIYLAQHSLAVVTSSALIGTATGLIAYAAAMYMSSITFRPFFGRIFRLHTVSKGGRLLTDHLSEA